MAKQEVDSEAGTLATMQSMRKKLSKPYDEDNAVTAASNVLNYPCRQTIEERARSHSQARSSLLSHGSQQTLAKVKTLNAQREPENEEGETENNSKQDSELFF